MKENEELDIRYTRSMDVTYLKEWVKQPEALVYFPMNNEEEIEKALAAWMFFCRYQASITATLQHIPCGIATLFLMPYKKISHQCSFKICVNPKHWREGIGSALIKNLKHLAKEYFHLEAIYTEVFDDNPLIALLKKFGFYEFSRQEKYIKTKDGYKGRVCLIADLKEGEKK
ncbi:MAG: GNAT family N-acetyltransferase [Verrucomicrobia bacterium]|nr:GNAT family N-acetyltransferase [Verrucomicrobiota bacterium]